jgi:hypothetical protein
MGTPWLSLLSYPFNEVQGEVDLDPVAVREALAGAFHPLQLQQHRPLLVELLMTMKGSSSAAARFRGQWKVSSLTCSISPRAEARFQYSCTYFASEMPSTGSDIHMLATARRK